MNRYPLWKYLIIALALVVGVLYALPNLFGESPAVQVSAARSSVKVDETTVTRVEQALERQGLKATVIQFEGTSVKARFDGTDTQIKARDAIERTLNPDPANPGFVVALNLVPRTPAWLAGIGASPMYLGLDLRGGVHFMLQVDMQAALQQRARLPVEDDAGEVEDDLHAAPCARVRRFSRPAVEASSPAVSPLDSRGSSALASATAACPSTAAWCSCV